jgi:hypothetical protein
MIIIAAASFALLSCKEDEDNPPANSTSTFTADLSGASEVPSNTSTATGQATLTFNNTTKIFTLNVTHSGLTPTMGHIHKGAVGESGDVVFPLTSLTSPITYTSPALTASQEADLKAGLYYVNLHTDAYPDGEIRGQLTMQGNP